MREQPEQPKEPTPDKEENKQEAKVPIKEEEKITPRIQQVQQKKAPSTSSIRSKSQQNLPVMKQKKKDQV